MIVIFTETSLESMLVNLDIALRRFDDVNEDLEYCLRRERAKEILTCRDLNIPYVVLHETANSLTPEKESAVIDTNIDFSNLPKEFTLVPRWRRTLPLPIPLRAGRFLVSKEQDQAISHWPSSIVSPDKYLKRMVYLATQHQFNELMISGSLETPIFIKGVSKGSYNFSLHHVFSDNDALNSMLMPYAKAKKLDKNVTMMINNAKDDDIVAFQPGTPWYCPYREMELISKPGLFNPENGVIISDVLSITCENNRKQEFRAFIVSGEVTSLSGYTDYDSMHVPSEIVELATEFAKENKDLAPAFVADFGMTERGPVLIELNGFDFSGRYLDNDPIKLYSTLRDRLGHHSYTYIEPAPIEEVKEPDFIKAIRANFDDSFSLAP